MKTKTSIIVAVALLGSLLSASAFANPTSACNEVLASQKFVAPVLTKIVPPTELPRNYLGATVMVVLTVDATGQPHDIKVVSEKDRRLTRSLVTAISQWQFTPGSKNGMPVETKVEFPLELMGS